jgi:hypothetical protein
MSDLANKPRSFAALCANFPGDYTIYQPTNTCPIMSVTRIIEAMVAALAHIDIRWPPRKEW